jgi:hypothetical protein
MCNGSLDFIIQSFSSDQNNKRFFSKSRLIFRTNELRLDSILDLTSILVII